MARKIYKRIGIRRDKNLGDLSDSRQGLNSLLDTLIDDTGHTFISEDLDVIRNLFAEGMSSGQYQKFIGSRTQKTTPTGSLTDLLPPVTYQNKLDKFQFFAGEPRLNGGNGLTARYYDQEDIDINTTNIFSGTPIKTDNFWEAGNFNYTGKITPLANNSNGGIEWNGFFVPTRTGSHTFRYASTGSFTFEFEDVAESGTITERMRIGTNHVISSDYPSQVAFGATFTASASGSGNVITLATANNSVRVGVGMSVSGTNIVKDSKVYQVSSGTITLVHPDVTEPDGVKPAVTGAISSQPLTFYRNTGVDVNKSYSTPTLIAYQKYRIKYRYFVPRYQGPGGTFIAIDSSGLDRNANMDFRPPGAPVNNNLPFQFLYGIDYNFSDDAKGTFPKFLDNSILFGGGTIGSPSNSSDYVKVKSTKKIDIKYIPPTSLNAITKATQTCGLTNGSSVASLSNTSGIEIGNYIFGTNIPENTRVIDIVINEFVIMDKNATGGGNQSLTFIDHRGFVKRVSGSSSGQILTISNGDTTNLKTDMIVIGTDVTQYTGIITSSPSLTNASTQVEIFPSQGHANRFFYFYESKGLRNDSLIQFCQPSIARCLKVVGTINPPSSTIEVESAPPGIVGYRVRGFQFSDATVGGVEGTRITQVTDPNSNGNVTITLSQPTVNPLLDDEKVSIAVANEGDRTLCCPPVDTSPPFQATEDGLQTTSSYPNLKINSGDVKFDNLTVIKNITVQDVSATDVSSKYLDLDANGVSYKILCE